MITVHHLESSRSQRVPWLLEELGVPYEIKRYARDPKTLFAPPELRAIHPLGKSPVITDDGIVVAESGAIVEYLIDRYGNGRLAPERGTEERRKYTYWLHYAEGSLMPLLFMKLVFHQLERAPVPFFVTPLLKQISKRVSKEYLDRQIKLHLTFIENELAKSTWFAGEEFSAADVQMGFPLEAIATRVKGLVSVPRIQAFLARSAERPAYQRALARTGGAPDLMK